MLETIKNENLNEKLPKITDIEESLEETKLKQRPKTFETSITGFASFLGKIITGKKITEQEKINFIPFLLFLFVIFSIAITRSYFVLKNRI